jgi:hypothetical protein
LPGVVGSCSERSGCAAAIRAAARPSVRRGGRSRPKPEGGVELLARPNTYWSDPKNKDPRSHRERYWSPTVHIRGGIAQVWAPYEFWIDGKTSHCGIDTFDMVKVDGRWRVANAMWTVEPDACAELRPANPANIRPAIPTEK